MVDQRDRSILSDGVWLYSSRSLPWRLASSCTSTLITMIERKRTIWSRNRESGRCPVADDAESLGDTFKGTSAMAADVYIMGVLEHEMYLGCHKTQSGFLTRAFKANMRSKLIALLTFAAAALAAPQFTDDIAISNEVEDVDLAIRDTLKQGEQF